MARKSSSRAPSHGPLDPALRAALRQSETADAGAWPDPQYMTVRQAAHYLAIDIQTVHNLLHAIWADGTPKLCYAPRRDWPNANCALLITESVYYYARRRKRTPLWHDGEPTGRTTAVGGRLHGEEE